MESLYNIMRPKTFDKMISNCPTLSELREDSSFNQLKHTYLMIGDRGCGKTTTARIIAKAYDCTADKGIVKPCGECTNCLKNNTNMSNIIEVNAGQFGKKENAEKLVESHKVQGLTNGVTTIIMDECHNLTTAAKEVLKKPIEEPPAHLRWIFCTDNPSKLDAAFLSRCNKHVFEKLTQQQGVDLVFEATLIYSAVFKQVVPISPEDAAKIVEYSEYIPREIVGNVEAYLSGDRNPEHLRMYSSQLENEGDKNTYRLAMECLSKSTPMTKAAALLCEFPDTETYETIRMAVMTTARKRWLKIASEITDEKRSLQTIKKCVIVLDEMKELLSHPKSVNDFCARILRIKVRIKEEQL